MRHRPLSHRGTGAILPGLTIDIARCIGCRLTVRLCVCALAPRVTLTTEILLVMHYKEWRRSSNTGHLLRLSTAKASIALHGLLNQPCDVSRHTDPKRIRGLLLYPSDEAVPLSRELLMADARPTALIVPDGNWNQARHIAKRLPGLAGLTRVSLPKLARLMDRPRRNISADRMSTYEAIAQALGILEGQAVEDELLRFFDVVAERMLTMRGRKGGDGDILSS